jgi:hypothetical protein
MLTRATSQAKANPDFEKLALYLLLRSVGEARKKGLLSCEESAKVAMLQNPVERYGHFGWYSTDLLRILAPSCGTTPEELLEIITPELNILQEKYPLLRRWKLDPDGMLNLWETRTYLLFHLTLLKRRMK